jgi:hypothetical protein
MMSWTRYIITSGGVTLSCEQLAPTAAPDGAPPPPPPPPASSSGDEPAPMERILATGSFFGERELFHSHRFYAAARKYVAHGKQHERLPIHGRRRHQTARVTSSKSVHLLWMTWAQLLEVHVNHSHAVRSSLGLGAGGDVISTDWEPLTFHVHNFRGPTISAHTRISSSSGGHSILR